MQFNSPVSDNRLVMKGFPGGSVIKNPPANAGDPGDTGLIPGWEDSLKEEVAIHSSILAWKIPWTEEPGGLQSIGLQRAGKRVASEVGARKV